VEPSDGPEASYAVLLKVPGGRVYCFYNHNTDNLRELKTVDGGIQRRVDSQGHFVFKYSDDHGRSWSAERYDIPVREMAIDRENVYGGKIRFFWNVGKPFIYDGVAYVSLHKVGNFGVGFFVRSEGVLLASRNLLTERDPSRVVWETLPEGDAGLRTPPGGGPIAEEQSYTTLSDGSFYVVYRSIDGYPVEAYSRDRGRTWSVPRYKCYADGRRMKHPRAANFVWKLENGKFLYWFHNHGGRFVPLLDPTGYNDRNPAWVCAGVEADSPEGKVIRWSEPEILLYDDDPYIRMSYPDLVEEGGSVYITETQKDVARTHEIDAAFLEKLFAQFENTKRATGGLALSLPEPGGTMPPEATMPRLPDFVTRDNQRADYGTRSLRTGFTLDLWLSLPSLAPGAVLLDNRTEDGRGFCLMGVGDGALELLLNDGRTENRWRSDPRGLSAGKTHHVAVVVDGGPRIISYVVDGRFCDGGEFRQFGWGRFSPNLRGANGAQRLRIGAGVKALRVYTRALMTSEVVGNFRAGP
ncbi:MAG: exo-alpha-sialidase, partial [Armatimonadota bacterium]|nr:exo-alpha-sialidase [Armatimonadota bacterium]